MTWFANLKTGTKLSMSCGVSLLLTILICTFAFSRMVVMQDKTERLSKGALVRTEAIANLLSDTKEYRIHQLSHILTDDPSVMNGLEAKMQDKLTEVAGDLHDYEQAIAVPEDHANFETLKAAWPTYLAENTAIIAAARINDDKKAHALAMGPALQKFNEVASKAEAMAAWNKKRGADLAQGAEDAFAQARSMLLVSCLASLLINSLFAFFVTRAIAPPLQQMASVAEKLAAGDVQQEITLTRKDEIGNIAQAFRSVISYQRQMADVAGTIAAGDLTKPLEAKSEKDLLGNAFVQMIASLSELVSKVQSASGSIATASEEVAIGSEDLSQRTEEQAASLEETAASMEEMAATVKQNADNTRQASQLATQARSVAEKGGAVVGQAVSSMEEINVVSKRITSIITVIDEIAFQTNLLALNAAVEAARVGEQGKGFAVVAAEVRALAGRSATAAKEIKALVQDSVNKVEEGSLLVHESGEQLGEIVTSVIKVADMITEISAAGQEQAEGIEQVNKAVMQMDQITQQNAALVEEATAASQSMSQQANQMLKTISQFKIDARFQQEQASETRMPMAQQATGTYGGGRPSLRAGKPKLTLATTRATSGSGKVGSQASTKTQADDHSDFEEF